MSKGKKHYFSKEKKTNSIRFSIVQNLKNKKQRKKKIHDMTAVKCTMNRRKIEFYDKLSGNKTESIVCVFFNTLCKEKEEKENEKRSSLSFV